MVTVSSFSPSQAITTTTKHKRLYSPNSPEREHQLQVDCSQHGPQSPTTCGKCPSHHFVLRRLQPAAASNLLLQLLYPLSAPNIIRPAFVQQRKVNNAHLPHHCPLNLQTDKPLCVWCMASAMVTFRSWLIFRPGPVWPVGRQNLLGPAHLGPPTLMKCVWQVTEWNNNKLRAINF